ncbi:hypothetical protein B0H13DRAFT_1862553 [Mycena leptocephala]|nr:hypothetical protein B0H13DRAFT_1862553 [Mycena leptocephala]
MHKRKEPIATRNRQEHAEEERNQSLRDAPPPLHVSDVIVFAAVAQTVEERKKIELTASNCDLSSVETGPVAAAFVLPPLRTHLLSRRSPCPNPSKTLACLSLGTSFWNCSFGGCFLWPHCPLRYLEPFNIQHELVHLVLSHDTRDGARGVQHVRNTE